MKRQKIYLGADHAGFLLKERIEEALLTRKLDLHDLSPRFHEDDDYPRIARRVANAVKKDPNSRGILVCGSGVGVTIAANRLRGIRAVDAHSVEEVHLAREHNDVNILALSGWNTNKKKALDLIDAFLKTPTSAGERHKRRVKQLG